MGKIAFVFSGQGDQYPGMGKELCMKYPVASDVYGMCDRIRPNTSKQCFEGTQEELKETKNTQPCLLAMELAAASVLIDKGIKPDALAGFSLGEVAAVTVGGIFDNETGFSLVCKRGELMQREAEKFDTSMAAVVKLTASKVQELCDKYEEIYAVNYNCPGQIAVSGMSSQMDEFSSDVKAAGGRAIPLKVKGAFHSPFMSEAAKNFAKEISNVNVKSKNSQMPVYSNMTALPYSEDVVQLLSQQICSPVQWEKTVKNMINDGIDTFIEIGPGKTLTNMIKKIDSQVKTVSVYDYLEEMN